jgi:hypothetical protein
MILALLIGCLTPETFVERFSASHCDLAQECDDPSVEDSQCEGAVIDCPNWDPGLAAICLDAAEARTCEDRDINDVCDFDVFCR